MQAVRTLTSDALWFTPLGAAQPDLERGDMLRLDATITPEEPIGLMLRTDSLPSATLQAWLSAVRQAAEGRRAPPPAAARKARRSINRR